MSRTDAAEPQLAGRDDEASSEQMPGRALKIARREVLPSGARVLCDALPR